MIKHDDYPNSEWKRISLPTELFDELLPLRKPGESLTHQIIRLLQNTAKGVGNVQAQ